MIESLSIQNFQSHKKSVLEFHPGVNVIIGESDSGKSAIIRAFRKLITNKPGGNSFMSYWGGEMNLSLTTKEGTCIRRVKTKSEDHYFVNDLDLTAFGQEVPLEVKEALNINEINCQYQFDPPFLLTKTPGELAQFFNRIANIEKIHLSTSKINSMISDIESDIKADEKRLEAEKEKLQGFPDLEKLGIELEVLEKANQRLQVTIQQRSKLNSIITQLKKITAEIEGKQAILKHEKAVNSILDLYSQKEEKETELNTLKKGIEKIKRIDESIKENNQLIGCSALVDELLELHSQKTKLENDKTDLEKFTNRIKRIDSELDLNKQLLGKYEAEFKQEMPDICPLCGK